MKKSELKQHLEKLIEYYEQIYNFNRQNGYNQVINKDISVVVAFGSYTAICDLYEKLF